MPEEKNPFQPYVDLGTAFVENAKRRAEELFRGVLSESETGREQFEDWTKEALARTRKASEEFIELIRDEVRRQVSALDLTTRDDVINLVHRVVESASEAAERMAGTARSAREAGEGASKRGTEGAKRVAKKAADAATSRGKKGAGKAPAKKAAAAPKPVADDDDAAAGGEHEAAPAKPAAKRATSTTRKTSTTRASAAKKSTGTARKSTPRKTQGS